MNYSLKTEHDAKRETNAINICSELHINKNLINYIETINGDSNNNGYHNFQHLLTVAINAYNGAVYYSLPFESRQALFLAGMLHDVYYSLENTEDVNISLAADNVPGILENFNVSSEVLVHVKELIKASYFPHKKPLTIEQEIIQDSDMMQNFEPDGHVFLKGLSEEFDFKGLDIPVDPHFPPVDMLNTEWAIQRKLNVHS